MNVSGTAMILLMDVVFIVFRFQFLVAEVDFLFIKEPLLYAF